MKYTSQFIGWGVGVVAIILMSHLAGVHQDIYWGAILADTGIFALTGALSGTAVKWESKNFDANCLAYVIGLVVGLVIFGACMVGSLFAFGVL